MADVPKAKIPPTISNINIPTIRATGMLCEIDGSGFVLKFLEERRTLPETPNNGSDSFVEVARIFMSQAGFRFVVKNITESIALHEKLVGPLNDNDAAKRKIEEAKRLEELEKRMKSPEPESEEG